MFIIFSFPFLKKKPRSIFNVFLVCIHLWYWSLIEIPHFVALDNIILPKYQFYSSIITTSHTRMPLVPTIRNRVAAAFWKMGMCSPYLDLTLPQKSLFRLQLHFISMVRTQKQCELLYLWNPGLRHPWISEGPSVGPTSVNRSLGLM